MQQNGELLARPNPDKKNHEAWDDIRDPMNIPRPYAMVINGLPNSGKTNTVLNLMIKADPVFNNIFLIHPYTFDYHVSDEDEKTNKDIVIEEPPDISEYKGVDFIALRYFPDEQFLKPYKKKRNLLIIDDVDLRQFISYSNFKKKRLNKLMSFCVSHCGLSIIITSQDINTQLLPIITRMCNIFCLYQLRDKNSIFSMSKLLGVSFVVLKYLYARCETLHDSVQIDLTTNTPYKYRKNWYEMIDPVIDFLTVGRTREEKEKNYLIFRFLSGESIDISEPEDESDPAL